MSKHSFAKNGRSSKRAIALALSAALLAAGAAGAEKLSNKYLYVVDDTAKGGAALRSDTDITRTNVDEISGNWVFTDKSPYEAKGGGVYSDASVTFTRSGGSLGLKNNTARGDGSWRDARGGAIFAGGDITLTASSVRMTDNKAMTTSDYLVEAFGGALYSLGGVTVTANGELAVKSNRADGKETGGGAIYARNDILLKGVNVTVQDNYTDGENNANGASSYGGAIDSGSGTVTLKAAGDIFVSGNDVKKMSSWSAGGAISAYKGITLEGGSVTVRWNTVTTSSSGEHKENNLADGGALCSLAGDVTIKATGAVTLANNSANDIGGRAAGGAVYTGKNVNLTGGSVAINGNKTDASLGTWASGGAIYAAGGASIEANGASIESNGSLKVAKNLAFGGTKDSYGGAIYAGGSGAFLTASGAITLQDNHATTNADAYAGAVYATKIEMIGSSIAVSKNTAESSSSKAVGGALRADSGEVTLQASGAILLENNAAKAKTDARGGAVYATGGVNLYSAGTLVITGTPETGLVATHVGGSVTVKGNKAESTSANADGGAVYAKTAKLSAPDGTVEVSGNIVTGPSSLWGAAIYAPDGIELTGGSVTVQGNKTENAGGTVYAALGTGMGTGPVTIVADDAVVIADNVASSTKKVNAAAVQSTILAVSGGSVAITGNTAKSTTDSVIGGAINTDGTDSAPPTITADGELLIADNIAQAAGGGLGGGIYSRKNIVLKGGSVTLRGNKAIGESMSANGGALDAFSSIEVTAEDELTISGNLARGAQGTNGGAACALNGSLTLKGGSVSVTDNEADGTSGRVYGGALYTAGSATITADAELLIEKNFAHAAEMVEGGAVRASSAVVLSGASVTVKDNRAESTGANAYGGAAIAYFKDISLTAKNSATVSGNEVSGTEATGGAFYAKNAAVKLTSDGSLTVSENKATGVDLAQGGAAWAAKNAEVTAADATFEKNKATATGTASSAYGGAMYVDSGTATVKAGGAMTFDGNSVTAGRSASGGAVAADSVALNGGKVAATGNTVSAGVAQGGAVYAEDTVAIAASGAEALLTNNKATGVASAQGGAVFADSVELSGAKVTANNNSVTGDGDMQGGAIYAGSAVTVTAGEAVFKGNSAVSTGTGSAHGGAIYSGGTVTLDVGTAKFKGNSVSALKVFEGGTIWAHDGVKITAAPRVSFASETDTSFSTVYSRQGDITVSGALNTGKGVSFSAYDHEISVTGSLEPLDVEHGDSVSATDLVQFMAKKVDLGGAQVALQTMFAQDEGDYKRDFAYVEAETLEKPKADNYRHGEVKEYPLAPGKKLTLEFGIAALTWYNGDGTWAVKDGNELWTRDSNGKKDDFYQADLVTFAPTTAPTPAKIHLAGSLIASSTTVKGSYAFSGGDLRTGPLTFTAGNSELATLVTADDAKLTGGTLKLSRVLTVKNSFTQASGTTLTVGASEVSALLNGDDTAALDASGGTLRVEGIGEVPGGTTKTYKVAEDFASLKSWGSVTCDATGLRLEYAPDTDGKTYYNLVVTALGNIPLIWNGGTNTWAEHDGHKRWLRESDGVTPDDFYNGDTVTFAPNGGSQTVTLEGALKPAAMTVNGDYTFAGSGLLNVENALTVSGGDVRFAREISANSGVLSGAGTKLTLDKPLTVYSSFKQKAGSTLIVDVNALSGGALLGGGTAVLTIKSGALLELKNATASESGVKYTIASGFNVESAWRDKDVTGDATGNFVKYAVLTEGQNVYVTVTSEKIPEPEPVRAPFLLTAGQSLRNAMNVGTAGQGRAFDLLTAPASPRNLALGFLPLEQDKTGGVWASAWYSHARVDNATADMTFKNYGVTIGADKQIGLGVAGVALNLGKTEGRGKGKFDGSDSDGKHLGLSFYGARQIARGRVTLTGDIGYNWHTDDYDSVMGGERYSARKNNSRVFTVGGTAWWNLRDNGKISVRPFLGLRYSAFRMDKMTVHKNGSPWSTLSGESLNQWIVPLGVKFDWTPVTTKKGWKVKPSVELAYIYAGGDRAMNIREVELSGGSATTSSQLLTDKNNFRASLGLDAKRKNMTVGVSVNALMSSGQKDVSVNATLRWDL